MPAFTFHFKSYLDVSVNEGGDHIIYLSLLELQYLDAAVNGEGDDSIHLSLLELP
jgi:hypothetical protein